MYTRLSKWLTSLTLIVIVLFWFGVIFIVATSAIPYNSSSKQLYKKDYLLFRALLPEGFSFFTRDPREPHVILYSKKDQREVELNNNSLTYLFGFRRYPRALNLEMSVIWGAVHDEKWYNCESGNLECLDDNLLPHYTVNSLFPKPILDGDYYLKVIEPIPWAWASSFKRSNKFMPCKVISISVKPNQ